MKQVVAFLEKYAEYLALGLAVVFLGYVAYSSILSNDAVEIPVGTEKKLPGEVDAAIASGEANRLKAAVATPASAEVKEKLKAPDFFNEFTLALGDKRPLPEHWADRRPFLPSGVPDKIYEDPNPKPKEEQVAVLPKLPPATPDGATLGQSFVLQPAPIVAGQPVAPAALPAAGQPVAGMDLTWITLEWKLDGLKVANAWMDSLFKKDPAKPGQFLKDAAGAYVPVASDAPRKTVFLWVEVEREEVVGKDASGNDKWGNKVTLKPLPLTEVSLAKWPQDGKFANPDDEEAYRVWAEVPQHQVDLLEPPFYQVVNGDPFYTKVTTPQVDPAAAAGAAPPVADNTPFDPANPPTNRELTPAEKQQVYLYKKKQQAEEQKQKMQEAKSRAAAAEQSRKGGNGAGTPRRGMGGGSYAPIPLAADGEFGSRPGAAPGAGRGTPSRAAAPAPAPNRGAPANTPGGGRGGNAAAPGGGGTGRPSGSAAERPNSTGPGGFNPATGGYNPTPGGGVVAPGSPPPPPAPFQPSPLLSGPFDPSEMVTNPPPPQPPVAPGAPVPLVQPTDIVIWAHDDAAQPGKTYRYRMRYFVKNPLTGTNNLAKNKADQEKFALDSPWSDYITAQAPQNVHFFFADRKLRPGQNGGIDSVRVDVFKREKGTWTKQTFTVVPGDGVGQTVNGQNFATGQTVVDLRTGARTEDVRILIADENGNVETRSLQADVNDAWYKELLQKVNAAAAGPNAGLNP